MARTTIKDYALRNNVSYEAIRAQIKRYETDLEGHIHKEGRTRFLDDFAVSFLDDRRKANPVIVQEVSKDEEINRYKEENDRLKTLLLEAQQRIISLQEDNAKQIEAEAKYRGLLADTERKDIRLREAEENLSETKLELSKAEENLENMKADLEEAQAEAKSYQKTFFGLYKKAKL